MMRSHASSSRWIMPAAAVLLGACAGHRQDAAARNGAVCEPRPGPLPAEASAGLLPGAFRLMMVATVGDSAGRTAEGRLDLQANDSTLLRFEVPGMGAYRDVTTPLFGTTDVPLAEVDAYQPGALDSEDPLAPGVLVLLRQAPDSLPQVTVRLGARANRRNAELLFDGGYAALRVTWIAEGAFGGEWESAVPNRMHSAGYFCANAWR